jgi:formylmethanofuran dehydrogenase subunit E
MNDGSDSDDQEEFEKIHLESKKEEIRKLLSSGTVSKKLYNRLEIFTAKPVAPEHIWKAGFKKCSTCPVCMEPGGQTCVEKCQTDGFRAHLWRKPHQD